MVSRLFSPTIEADFSSAALPRLPGSLPARSSRKAGLVAAGGMPDCGDRNRRHEHRTRRAVKTGFPTENGGHAGRRREDRLDRAPSLKARRPIGGPTTAPAPHRFPAAERKTCLCPWPGGDGATGDKGRGASCGAACITNPIRPCPGAAPRRQNAFCLSAGLRLKGQRVNPAYLAG